MSTIGHRTRVAASAVAIAAAVGVPAASAIHNDPNAGKCVAHVNLYEDGSWNGGEITDQSGRVLAPEWDVQGPALQGRSTQEIRGAEFRTVFHTNFPASVNGQNCVMVF